MDAVRASFSIPLLFESRKLRNERMGAESTLVDGGVLSKFPVETSIGGRVRIRAGRGSGSNHPGVALCGRGAVAAARASDASAGPVTEQFPAAASVGHDHNDIERPCVGRGIIDVDTRSIGIIEFSANQGQEAAQCARCCARSPSAGRRNDDDAGRSRRGARARGHESRLGSRRER
jgi:predicted acylesterase/phospholipase RssA